MKSIWLKIASVFQIITGIIHSLSLFTGLQPQNESEKQIIDLMNSYRMDGGPGFAPSFSDLFLALSSCFTLLYLMTGILNFYLLRHSLSLQTWRGIHIIQIVFFGAGFFVMYAYTFIYPVILTGLCFLFLVISYFANRSEARS